MPRRGRRPKRNQIGNYSVTFKLTHYRFAARLDVLPFDADAADHAADIRANLERRGQTIGGYDLLIAGHARSRGLIVVTGNPGEFRRVDGLRCEDWEGTSEALP